MNTMFCPFKVNSNTIELTMHTSCDCDDSKTIELTQGIKTYILMSKWVQFSS